MRSKLRRPKPSIIHPHHLTHPEILPLVAPAAPPPLPPSVEAAYKKKCVQLKKRMVELDESNDAARLRKMRNTRFINKMRLERAYLLEKLCELQKKNGEAIEGLPTDMDEESEGSSEGPPTPHEKPLRSKRSHRRPLQQSPPPHSALAQASTTRPHGIINSHRRGGPGAYESTFPAHQSSQEYHDPRTHHQPIINGYPTVMLPDDSRPRYPGLGPVPMDPWNQWVHSHIKNNPDIQQSSEADQLNAARAAWNGLSALEQESWQEECQKRSLSYENAVRQLEGRRQHLEARGGDEDSVAEGEDEVDEEMEDPSQRNASADDSFEEIVDTREKLPFTKSWRLHNAVASTQKYFEGPQITTEYNSPGKQTKLIGNFTPNEKVLRELAQAAVESYTYSSNMVATRSQDQASPPSTQQHIATDNSELPIRAKSSKRRRHDRETTVVNRSDRKRQKVDRSDEHDTSATFAAVVIPTSKSEIAGKANKKAQKLNPNGLGSEELLDELRVGGMQPTPSRRERATTDGIESGSQKLREHTKGRMTVGKEKKAVQDETTLSSDPKSTKSLKKKTKQSHRRDPRMDLPPLVDSSHGTTQAGSGIISPKAKTTSRHKRFDGDEGQSAPPEPNPQSLISHVSGPSRMDEDAERSSSEDDAPEVVTKATGLKEARSTATEAARAIEAQRAVKKQKRQERDRLLKTQAKAPKKQAEKVDALGVEPGILSDDDTPDQIAPSPLASSDQIDWSDQRTIPDLLPEELLAAEPPARLPTPPLRADSVKVSANKKRRFLEKPTKPAKDIKRGGVRIRVLNNTKSILPPKVAKSSQMIRESWLSGRKGSKGRVVMERRKLGTEFIRR
ncbi:MAG: hypothetical protein Q9212_006156 [Teloschistes hypoglaucus]